jgi:hypothetical protein
MAAVVYQYGTPVPPFGAIDAGDVGVFPIYEGLDPANLGAHEGMGLLIVAAPFNPDTVTTTPGPLPFGTAEGALAYTFDNTGSAATIYPAATHGATSAPDDTPADTYVPSAFTGEVQNQLSLFNGADPLQPGQAAFGELQIIDPNGDDNLDDLLALGWEGAAIELRRGVPGEAFSTWSTVAKLTATGMVGDIKAKSLRLRSMGWLLEAAELHGERYGGTGGLDGDPTLAGRLKPYAVGYVSNITPVTINAVKLIGQVSRSAVTSITNVTDGHGTALLSAGDFGTYDALAGATIPVDGFATCLALGLYRLGAAPVFGITCNVQGDAETVNGLAGPTSRGRIVRRIAAGLGSLRLMDSTQIDFAAFQDFENKQPAAVGWYWDGGQQITKAAAIAEVMAGCCGWWLVRPNGQLSIGQAEDPASFGVTLTLAYPATDSGECRLGEPAITDTLPPRRATYIGWQRNYTVQTPDKLAGSVSQADTLLYGQPTRYAGGADQWRANNYPTSPAVYLFGNYRDEADAIAEADRQMQLFSVQRTRYAIPIAMDPLADVVGQRAQIDNLNRLGWGSSKALLTCGLQAAGNSVTLHFWG